MLHFDLLLNSLPIMGYGMLGIFVVTGVIIGWDDTEMASCFSSRTAECCSDLSPSEPSQGLAS